MTEAEMAAKGLLTPAYAAVYEAKHKGVLAFKPHSVFLKEHGLGRLSHQRHALTTAPLKGIVVAEPEPVAEPVIDYKDDLVAVVMLLGKEPAHKRTFDKVAEFSADVIRVLPVGDQERVLAELCDMIEKCDLIATPEQASKSLAEERRELSRRVNPIFYAVERGDISWAHLVEAEEARIRAMKTPEELAAEAAAKAKRAEEDARACAAAEVQRRADIIRNNKNNSLRLGNLPRGIKEETLREHFGPYGRIVSLRIPLKKGTSETRGFAFIEYSHPADAAKALYAFNDSPLTLHESYKSPDGFESEKDRLVTVEFTSS